MRMPPDHQTTDDQRLNLVQFRGISNKYLQLVIWMTFILNAEMSIPSDSAQMWSFSFLSVTRCSTQTIMGPTTQLLDTTTVFPP